MTESIGIIGVGEIARAIVDGLCGGGYTAPTVYLSPRGAAVSAELAHRHPSVHACTSNQEVAEKAAVVIVAVRPEALDEALGQVRITSGSLVISVVAGVDHEELHILLGPTATVVRAIPLPAVCRRDSVTVIYPPHPMVKALFDDLGGTLELDDSTAFAALSATSGTIASYLHYLATIAAWAGRHGMDPVQADRYIRGVFRGVSDALADGSRSLAELAADHETPGGLNEQLHRAWFDEINAGALDDALDGLLERVTRPAEPDRRRPGSELR